MDSLADIVLRELSRDSSVATRLRSRYVGAIIDCDRLGDAKFKQTSKDDEGWTTWTRRFTRNTRRIVLDIAPLGTIARLRISKFLDLRLDGIGAPYGWYRTDYLTGRMEHILDKAISSAVRRRPPDDAETEWAWHLERLGFDAAALKDESDPAYIICCHANQYRTNEGDSRLASLLTVSLTRHIESIENANVIADLPWLCGRLGLHDECLQAIRKLIELGSDAEAWCNTGAVLCDNLRLPTAAIACFKMAIECNTELLQPRQGIWVAGKNLMAKALLAGDYDRVLRICEETEHLGDPRQADHGFWSYAGLAYESIGAFGEARSCYKKAISHHPDCSTSGDGLKRVNASPYDPDSFHTAVMRIRGLLEYADLIADEDL